MVTDKLPKKWMEYTAVFLIAALVLSLLIGNSGLCTLFGLLLVAGAMLYLRQQENVTEQDVALRIKAEYPAESQQHVYEIYEHLKIKEMDGLFQKILDESKGDVEKVEKLASVAESVGWNSFLDNHW